MKALISKVALLALLGASFSGFAAAQLASVRGTCKDAQGAPIVSAEIVWKNNNNGRTYKLKTDKKGNYFSLGVEPGDYTVTLSKDGQVLDTMSGLHVGLEEFTHDIDLKQAHEQNVADTAKKQGKSAEEVKQELEKRQAEADKTKTYNENVKVVNAKLLAADELLKAQNYSQAIAGYQEAATILPDSDIVLYRLGRGFMESAKAEKDPAEKVKQYTEAYNDFRKAVELRKAAPAPADAAKVQQSNLSMAVYYDNLGAAAGRVGKMDEVTQDYEQAVQLDPGGAARYYFNLGVVLHNSAIDNDGRKKAADAFDKAITADPTKAEAYFLKGSDLLGLATTDPAGKLIPVPGTVEALQKYLELQPTGPNAEAAKGMLTLVNTTIESSYGGKKAPPKKK